MKYLNNFEQFNKVDEDLKSTIMAGAIGAATIFGGKSKASNIEDDKNPKGKNITNIVKKDLNLNYNLMNNWNKLVDFLEKEGVSGSEKMNNIEFSKNMFNKYKKENPNSPLTYEHTYSIQKEIRNYRNESIEKMKKGEIQKAEDIKDDYSNFMPWVDGTDDDGIIGKYTSKFKFPLKYINLMDINGTNKITHTIAKN